MRRGGGAPRKDGGGEGGKVMGPLFPRLHVNDTTLKGGGPRAPPRNKMALYEQFSVPSQRFNATANANANATTPHRPAASYAVSSASAGKAKFVCACFGGAIEVSKFSENTMTSLRKKLSKMLRRLAGCLWCNDCSTHVTCCGNHDVYYCGNEGVTRDDGRQGGGSHEGGSQQAVPDLISL